MEFQSKRSGILNVCEYIDMQHPMMPISKKLPPINMLCFCMNYQGLLQYHDRIWKNAKVGYHTPEPPTTEDYIQMQAFRKYIQG